MSGPVVSSMEFKEGEGPPGNWRSWLIWGTASLFYLYEFVIRVAPSVMEKELQSALAVSAGTFGLATGVYYYVYSPMQIGVGLLLDKWGVKRILVPSAIICGLGCLLCMATTDVFVYGLGRGLMGLGSAFAFVGCMHLATVWFPASRIALLSGLTTTLGVAGAMVAQRPMVELVSASGWRASWVYCAAGGLVIAVLIWIFVPKPPPWEANAKKTAKGEKDHTVLEGLLEVVKNPQSWIIGLIGAALFFNLSVFGALWGDDYVERLAGVSTAKASNAISFLYFGWLVGAPVAGWVSDKLQKRKPVLIASLILTCLISFSMLMFSEMPIWLASVYLFVLGVVSSGQIITFVSGLEHNPDWASATAIAFNNMVVMLIGGVFQPVVGVLLDVASGGGNTELTTADYRIALMSMPVICIIGLIASIFLKESYSIREDSYEALAED